MAQDKESGVRLLRKYGISEEKIRHCINVANIARFLAERLKEKGEEVDADFLYFSAIVHDIGGRMRDKDAGKDRHGELGADILRKEGLGKVADLIVKHPLVEFVPKRFMPVSWEEKILNYADKRERFGKIVSLKERKEGYLEGFPDYNGKIIKSFEWLGKVEKEIFSILEISPDGLKNLVKEE